MTRFKKGERVLVKHSRSGTWFGIVQEDFDSEIKEFPKIAIAPGNEAHGLNTDWYEGDMPPCRLGLCTIRKAENKNIPAKVVTYVPMDKWAKDHWSTFAYVETLAVENKGIAVPDLDRMRTNGKTHPHLVGYRVRLAYGNDGGSEYPTRLKNGDLKGHDDWDCLDDAINEGLLEDIGTGMNRAFKLTEKGQEVAERLRRYKMNGGNLKEFKG